MTNLLLHIDNFVSQNNLRPADAFVVKKEYFGILDHYVIYLGRNNQGLHVFIANYTKGIRILQLNDLAMFLSTYLPVRINRFQGTENQRTEAIQRAISRKDENSYHLILHNCEHYKNYVHYGFNKSDQVKNAGIGLALAGAATCAIGAANKNKNATIAGIVMAGIGLIVSSFEE